MPLSVSRVHRAELSGELWGVTAYFNPVGFATKLERVTQFAQAVRAQNLKLLIVELALCDAPFSLPSGIADQLVRVRSNTVLWHKERLLNLGVACLPANCDKVAWLDADILFENPLWVADASRLLRDYVIVQPFDTACWLPRPEGNSPCDGASCALTMPGIARAMADRAEASDVKGHPGFAWVARRTVLVDHGLYDRSILGGADLVITSAMYLPACAPIAGRWMNHFCSAGHIADVARWTDAFYSDVRSSVSYVPGAVYHLWHGDRGNRQYDTRYSILKDDDFDPAVDIGLDESGCWQWTSEKPRMHRRVTEYFSARREDG